MSPSMLSGGMLPADGVELPRLRRASGSLKKLGLTVVSQSVSVGRSRRPWGEVNQGSSPG